MIGKLALVAFWLLVAAISVWTLSPLQYRPQTGHVFLERFGAFFALGVAFTMGHPKRTLLALGVVSLIAVGLEVLQTFVPTRHGAVLDALEKLSGGLTGVALAALLIAAKERSRRASHAV